MIKIEIASYPKSGNTWFRYITKDFLSKLGKKSFDLPPDIHHKFELVEKYNSLFIEEINDEVMPYKSHIYNHPKVIPDKIIHIYRHPLDVFLSTRNHFYNRSKFFNENNLKRLFIDGISKSVEEIARDNELDYYFNQFMEDAGSTWWLGMLGEKSNYFKYVFDVMQLEKAISLKYEDLINNTSDLANNVFSNIWNNIPYIQIDNDAINSKTKNSKDKFYWKSRAKNYEKYLTKEQVNAFNKKYETELVKLGYL